MLIEQIEISHVSQREKGVNEAPDQLRIVSWNIGRGGCLDAISAFLRTTEADLILLQEVDESCRRTGNRKIARELSHRLQINCVSGVEFQELSEGSKGTPAYHGRATLSPWPIEAPRVLHFRSQSNFWKPSWWIPSTRPFQRRLGGRMALVSKLCIGPIELVSYNVHLESRCSEALRHAQLRELLRDASSCHVDGVVVVGGDFNCDVGRAPQGVVISEFGFRNTFSQAPATTVGGSVSIDSILIRGRVLPLSAEVRSDIDASDHYPLLVTLQCKSA